MSSGKGGGGGQAPPTSQTVTQTNLPEYARPYFERLMDRSEGISQQPYPTYQGARLEGLSQNQQQAITGAQNLQIPGQFGQGTDLVSQAGIQGLNAGQFNPQSISANYAPQGYENQNYGINSVNAPNLSPYDTGQYGINSVNAPNLQGVGQYSPGQYGMMGVQSNFDPSMFRSNRVAPNLQVQSQSFDQNSANQYMSPYLQSALNPALNEIRRNADMAQSQLGNQAAQSGALGGYRHGIQAAEMERNAGIQQSNVLSQGYQNAFQNAQQQFNSDQAARMQAQQSNLGAGMQAQLANQGAGLQAQQLGEQSRQFGTQSGMQAQLANQGALQNLNQLLEQSRQYGAGLSTQAGLAGGQMGLQAQLANQQAQQQANQLTEQSRQYGAGVGIQGAQLGLQAGLANQGAQQNLNQLLEQSRQYGAGLNSQQGQFGANLGLQAQQQNVQNQLASRGLGLQGLQTAIGAGGQLGQLGSQQYGAGLQGLNALQTTGALQQQQGQSGLDLAYTDFMNSMNFPRQQLNFMSGILRGVPVSASSDVQQFQAPPSPYSQLMGLGLAGAGIGKLVGGS